MQQLSNSTLGTIDDKFAPKYRLQHTPQIGLVHLGPGAFFRGHQAWYTHKAMQQSGGDWAISCVSMRSAGVYDALTPQDGLYTVAVLDADTSFEVVSSINEVLVAKDQYLQVHERLVNPNTQFVTMTITEKGYCINSDGELDLSHTEIQQDLTESNHPITAVGLLIRALAERKSNGSAPFTILSCDNLTDNGKKLRAALVAYAKHVDQALALWLDDKLICPCTMVDSITPATDDALRTQVAENLDITDNWPVKRESFVQWVIEDILPDNKPDWQAAGVTFTSDVQGFENAKLRLLNCPHSAIAYIGELLGIETVFDAMQNKELVEFVMTLINEEVIPSFSAPKELNVSLYSSDILDRFRNPAIRHLLSQIAWDGSQKLPMRVLPIIEQNIKDGRSIKLLSTVVAAWCLFCRKRFKDSETLVDPLASKINAVCEQCNDTPEHDIQKFLKLNELFPEHLALHPSFITDLISGYRRLLTIYNGQKTKLTA